MTDALRILAGLALIGLSFGLLLLAAFLAGAGAAKIDKNETVTDYPERRPAA